MTNVRSTLESLLKQYSQEEPLSYEAIHGFLTAQTICPTKLAPHDLNEFLFECTPSLTADDKTQLDQSLQHINQSIDRMFNEEEGVTLPCDMNPPNPDNEGLTDWCAGFMEGHFLNEDQWFIQHDQEVCELLLPVILASGLFDEEPDMTEILKQDALTREMYEQLPEVLMELYLLFQAPEEKPYPKTTKTPPKKQH